MEVFFISSNECKIKEVTKILSSIKITPYHLKIDEIQHADMEKIVKDKTLKAFKAIRRPVIVEQTGLLIEALGDFPGGLTQIFWDSLEAEKFSKYFSKLESGKATAKTVVGFCDGKKLHVFEAVIEGTIVEAPRGSREFQWDCIFQPNGYDKTFAELEDIKNEISMRRKALDSFRKFFKEKYE